MYKVAVIGDNLIDETWYGDVTKLSPEAPIPVHQLSHKVYIPGGAANVARNVKALLSQYAEVALISNMSTETKQWLANDYQVNSWSDGNINNKDTNIKLRIVDEKTGYHLVRVDNETLINQSSLNPDLVCKYLKEFEPETIIFSDYNKGAITDELVLDIMSQYESFYTSEKPEVLVDSRRPNIECYKGCSLITPNMSEYHSFLKHLDCESPWELIEVLELYDGLLLTMSNEGMDFCMNDNDFTVLHAEPTQKEIIDVTGAGDTVIATVAALLTIEQYVSWRNIINIASITAGEVCMKRGTAIPNHHLGWYLKDLV